MSKKNNLKNNEEKNNSKNYTEDYNIKGKQFSYSSTPTQSRG